MSQVVPLSKQYTEREAARLLGLNFKALQRLRRSGRIGFLRLTARRIVYLDRHLDAFRQSCEVKPCPNASTSVAATTSSAGRTAHASTSAGTSPNDESEVDAAVRYALSN